jgi:hypothetical protein
MIVRGATYDSSLGVRHPINTAWIPSLLDNGVQANWFPPDVIAPHLQQRQERTEAVREAIVADICGDVCVMIETYIGFSFNK